MIIFGNALNGDTFWPPNRSFHFQRPYWLGVRQNLVARQRAIESLMIKRRASLPSFNFRFVQEQESISIAKKDKTLIKVSDLFSRRKTFSSLRFMGTLGSFSLNLTSRLLRGRPNVRTFEVCFHILWNMKPKRWIWIQIRRVWWRHTFRGLRFESLDSCPTGLNRTIVSYGS